MGLDEIKVGALLWWDCGGTWRRVKVARVYTRGKRLQRVSISWTDKGRRHTARVGAATLRVRLPVEAG